MKTARPKTTNRKRRTRQSQFGSNGSSPPLRPNKSPKQKASQPDYTDDELRQLEQAARDFYQIQTAPFPAPMEPEAFHGPAGDVISIIAKDSELCPEALLAQFLTAFGNAAGRGPHRRQGGIHHPNLFTVLVGDSGSARKGSSWTAIENLLEKIDPDWIAERKRDSFQSGEAIIHAIRDPSGPGKNHDPGEPDKRLLIMEEEFARLLDVASRPGNTISPTLRKLWESRKYQFTEAKLSREKATDPHVSLIGHITQVELIKCMPQVENKNGFSNRILWIATKRAQLVPIPAWIDWNTQQRIVDLLIASIDLGRKGLTMSWTDPGREAWKDFYSNLERPKSGILADLCARAEAQVLRLSMLYALLDGTNQISPTHLQAALAFWRYASDSAKWIFGQKTGNRLADRILGALQRRATKQMSRAEIQNDVCQRNQTKAQIDEALSVLRDGDLVSMRLERSTVARKPAEIWQLK